MHRTIVLLVVGLTPDLIGENTPNLLKLSKEGGQRPLKTITPAVTCSTQATFMTGTLPGDHGCVANGWYFRDLGEVLLWRQPERLVHGEKIWDAAKKRNPEFTCAKMFWWYNMYSSADWSVTPRPLYPADGRKLPDIWTDPTNLRQSLNNKLGTFPLFNFWGPTADIVSSKWIAQATLEVYDSKNPTLTLAYLPHLDYNLQRLGPDHPQVAKDLQQIDDLCGEIIGHVQKDGTRVIVLSEYGITKVNAPIHINRALREAGLISHRLELGKEMLQPGSCEAFAVADHQIAHVYVKNPGRISQVKNLLENLDGVERVLDGNTKVDFGLDHQNSGELVAISKADRWFTYYYWLDDDLAPDYARTVDIHRKPGYDPAELFIDPDIRLPKLKVGLKLARKILGFRYLMDVISLDASVVKGSHGRVTDDPNQGPVLITSRPDLLKEDQVHACDVKKLILDHVFDPSMNRGSS